MLITYGLRTRTAPAPTDVVLCTTSVGVTTPKPGLRKRRTVAGSDRDLLVTGRDEGVGRKKGARGVGIGRDGIAAEETGPKGYYKKTMAAEEGFRSGSYGRRSGRRRRRTARFGRGSEGRRKVAKKGSGGTQRRVNIFSSTRTARVERTPHGNTTSL
jgi:hypothetical protein